MAAPIPGMGGGFQGGGGGGGGRRFYRETDEKPKITKELLARIFSNFLPHWKSLVLIGFAVIITAILGLVPPLLTKQIIDVALPDKDLNLLIFLVVVIFLTSVISGLIEVGQSYLNNVTSKSIIRDLRTRMFTHLQNMPISFFSNIQPGEITSRINNDIGGIEGIFSNTFIQLLQNIFIFISTLLTLLYTNWVMAIISLLIVPIFVFPTRKVGKTRWHIATKTQEKLAKLNSIIIETLNISGTMLVKLFTKEKQTENEFITANNEVISLQIKESLVGRWFFMIIHTVTSVGPMMIYLAGGFLFIKYNSMTIGGIVMFVSLLGRLYNPVTSLFNMQVDITRSMALFERIFQYFDMPLEIENKKDAAILPRVNGHVEFRDVSFSYNEKAMALKGINIDVKPGHMAAFVGPSGAGKTTLTYLVPRLYDSQQGEILIDGYNVKDVTLESLRQQIGMVTQDTYLFNDTILSNLLFAKSDATEKEIHDACISANIHSLIMSLPDQYNTVVGDRGIKLSGGEKQRLSIARAILKNPRIIIFDEATSALDSNSETQIQNAMQPLLNGRTSLIIAHRLSTIMAADCIYVVNEGTIVEKGTHDELLESGGIYKDLYEKQFKRGLHADNK